MHKRTHLTLSENQSGEKSREVRKGVPKRRSNRRRRDWNRPLRRIALGLALVEAGFLLFANPYLHVTRVRVDGAQTLSAEQVFDEARVPQRTNILWILRQPFGKRLTADPIVEQASCSIHLPNLLVLTVKERQPKAVVAGGGQFWLVDAKSVAYRRVDGPLPGIPLVQAASAGMPLEVTPGQSLRAPWLSDAFSLLNLLPVNSNLSGLKIVVDQSSNLCLNRKDGLQIRLGQPENLPQKMVLAEAAVAAHGRESAYIDVSSPEQMVRMPRPHVREDQVNREDNGPEPRTD